MLSFLWCLLLLLWVPLTQPHTKAGKGWNHPDDKWLGPWKGLPLRPRAMWWTASCLLVQRPLEVSKYWTAQTCTIGISLPVSHTLVMFYSFRIRHLGDANLETDYSLWQAVCNFSPESPFVLNGSHLLESEYSGCLVQVRSESETEPPIRLCGRTHLWESGDLAFGSFPLAESPECLWNLLERRGPRYSWFCNFQCHSSLTLLKGW